MMKMRGLLIAVVVLAALAGGVYWSNKAKQAEATQARRSASTTPKILAIPADRISKIEIRKTGGDTTVVEREVGQVGAHRAQAAGRRSGRGRLHRAPPSPALNADRIIEEKAQDLAQYGLASPPSKSPSRRRTARTASC